MAAHQAPPSLGFSRQEHWSGLPFYSPMRESEVKSLSRVRLLATPWTATHQAPPPRGFSRQEYWSRVPLPFPEEISSLSHSVVFLYFFALIAEEGFLIPSLLFFGILHSDAYIFPFLLCFSLLFFSQLFVRPPQTAIFLFCISFP